MERGKHGSGIRKSMKLLLFLWMGYVNVALFSVALARVPPREIDNGDIWGFKFVKDGSRLKVERVKLISGADIIKDRIALDLGSCHEVDDIAKKSLCCSTLTKLAATHGATLTSVRLANSFLEKEPALGIRNLEDTVRTCKLNHTDDIILPLARQLLSSTALRPCTSFLDLLVPFQYFLMDSRQKQADSCCLVVDDLATELHHRGFRIEQEEINNTKIKLNNASNFGKKVALIRKECALRLIPPRPIAGSPVQPHDLRKGYRKFSDIPP